MIGYPELAAELVRLKVDIIVVAGGDALIRAAKNATKTIPIVMVGPGIDPVKAGLVESLARPGGNVTGITNLTGELGGKRLELLKEAVPKVARVAVLYDPATPATVLEVKEVLPVAARALGLTVRSWEVRAADGFERVFAALNKQRPDGLYVTSGPLMNANQKRIVGFALKSRLPSVYNKREAVDAGGLMSYGADIADSYRRVAYYVDRILKGAKPADLPVEQPTKFELVINLKTAKQIGRDDPAVDAVAGGQSDQMTVGGTRLRLRRISLRRNRGESEKTNEKVFLRRIILLAAIVDSRHHRVAAQDKALKKIIWGQTSISSSQWIPWIAKDAKIYEKYGLDVDIVYLRGGSGDTSKAIIAGSIFAAPVTTATVMTANLSGADLTTVAHTVKAVQSRVVARPELKRPEDIKGKRLASTGLGSLGDFLHRVVMKRYGVNPERDVTWLTIGSPPDRVQALEAKLVDAADLSYPFDVQAQKKGYRVLWDARIEVPYPSMSVVTRKKTIQDDRDTVMRMMRAHVEGIHFLKTQKEASQKILAKYLKNNDRELLEGSYEIYKDDFIATPYPITQGLETTYEYVAPTPAGNLQS